MSARRKFIAGNWKMTKTATEGKELVTDILRLLSEAKFDDADVIVCPPYTALVAIGELLANQGDVILGAQNLHHEAKGAYTGEVSASMLKDLYCRYVITGHSERREYFGETDELINKKSKIALEAGLRPIICVGEKLEDREANKTFDVIKQQCKGSFANFSPEDWANVIVAYEPVWAIGTGKTATPEQAQEVHAFIREQIKEIADETIANRMRILYGGSVKPSNAEELCSEDDIDGALVGGASLEAESFVDICKNACASA